MRTTLYLNWLDKDERVRMTEALPFLRNGEQNSREKLIQIASELYGKGTIIDFRSNNGHLPSEFRAQTYGKGRNFYTLMQFERKEVSDKCISVLGHRDNESYEWRYFYGISLCDEDRELYIISFSNACSPNWNNEYNAQMYVRLADVDFPILKDDGVMYRMDDSLHAAINAKIVENTPKFLQTENGIEMMVRDQHGNYKTLVGKDLDSVFRYYADNCTGYKNYRRQDASEWVIVDDNARQKFEEWKKTAVGLKSDFDKFYGGGIVD